MIRRISVLLSAILLTALPVRGAHAQNADSCTLEVVETMRMVHDEYRSVVFGSTGSTVIDGSGSVIRTGGIAPEDRIGIFETKYRMTSELVEPLVESYRVLRCNALAVCAVLDESFAIGGTPAQGGTTTMVQPPGCAAREMPVLTQCAVERATDIAELRVFCSRMAEELLSHERAVLRLSVAYDSGYRSLLQMMGMFDAFIEQVPKRTFLSLRQMVGLLGKLHQIPCFLGHCDMPPPPGP